jgi:hypothetical protein
MTVRDGLSTIRQAWPLLGPLGAVLGTAVLLVGAGIGLAMLLERVLLPVLPDEPAQVTCFAHDGQRIYTGQAPRGVPRGTRWISFHDARGHDLRIGGAVCIVDYEH